MELGYTGEAEPPPVTPGWIVSIGDLGFVGRDGRLVRYSPLAKPSADPLTAMAAEPPTNKDKRDTGNFMLKMQLARRDFQLDGDPSL
jgi:hypothetical protein